MKKELLQLGLSVQEIGPYDIPDFNKNPAFSHERDYTDRKNVIGIWKGTGGGKSVLLTGHMDVAPKEPMEWKVCEPYESVVKNGRIYGRGTADMKGGLACALSAIKTLKEKGFTPKGDIIFETVVDEEYSGANGTLASRMSGINADFGIILEPTGLDICPGCVGSMVYRMTITGNAGMPYTGEKISNPILDMRTLLNVLKEYDKTRMSVLKKPKLWDKTEQEAQLIMMKLKAGEVEPSGQLSAPVNAWTELVIQTYPNETEEEVVDYFLDFIKKHYPYHENLNIEAMYHYCKAAQSDLDFPGIDILHNKAKKYIDSPVICGAMFSCDLYALNEYGNMPGVIFGPKGERLHGPDEWVDIDSQIKVTQTLLDFISDWCG
ncbi:M20/M25/M40 family metallo-hydrolase [Robinsoniella peoriensis]|uniref:M20/M25/M40 family metallo-hydrolase n=1 Tax=Robinsoniella peoriensis TaxID=180332 RepID=UPI001375484B|nr:M20/M25/M40 family metallo-hydrolase [Robinsoniella peoriensis]MDU7030560.1 M20/M25/M40 family metallo-hydrolase [Clostridiales bacterium]